MARIQHHGIILVDPEAAEYDRPQQREWPKGFTSYNDSYLVWGEHRLNDAPTGDPTLHVIYEGKASVPTARFLLSHFLYHYERLVDYASESDKEDWSKDEQSYYLEDFFKGD